MEEKKIEKDKEAKKVIEIKKDGTLIIVDTDPDELDNFLNHCNPYYC